MWCGVSFTVREVRFVLPFPRRGFSLLREGKYTCRGGPYNRSWASWIKVHPLGFSGCGGAREWQLHGPTVSFLCLSGSEIRLWCVLLLLPSPETGDSLDRSARTPSRSPARHCSDSVPGPCDLRVGRSTQTRRRARWPGRGRALIP